MICSLMMVQDLGRNTIWYYPPLAKLRSKTPSLTSFCSCIFSSVRSPFLQVGKTKVSFCSLLSSPFCCHTNKYYDSDALRCAGCVPVRDNSGYSSGLQATGARTPPRPYRVRCNAPWRSIFTHYASDFRDGYSEAEQFSSSPGCLRGPFERHSAHHVRRRARLSAPDDSARSVA